MNINFYSGNCHTCNKFVDKREGFYHYGNVYCTETITISTPYSWDVCVPQYNHYNNTAFATLDQCHANEENKVAAVRAEQNIMRDAKAAELIAAGKVEALAATAKVRSLTQVINKVLGADIAVADMTYTQLHLVMAELQSRIDRKTRQTELDGFKANQTCPRCGGAGQADKWEHTGKVCYRCGGSGKY